MEYDTYSRSYSKKQRVTVTRYYPALTTTTSRIVPTSSPGPRRWFGAQTAYTYSDWLKQLKRFTAELFVLADTKNSFERVLFQFRFSFISIVRTV